MSAELGALLLADARLPTGGHAHSAGLEPALESGLTAGSIPSYIDARLWSVGWVEAAAAVLALRVAQSEPGRLEEVQEHLAARMPSAPLRHASGLLGRGLARLASRLWPEHPATVVLNSLGSAPMRSVSLGVVAAATGMDAAQVARVSLYDDAQTVAAAALKLLPVDPTDATRWLLEASESLETVVELATATESVDQLPALSAPQVEQWSLEHDIRTRRIFVA